MSLDALYRLANLATEMLGKLPLMPTQVFHNPCCQSILPTLESDFYHFTLVSRIRQALGGIPCHFWPLHSKVYFFISVIKRVLYQGCLYMKDIYRIPYLVTQLTASETKGPRIILYHHEHMLYVTAITQQTTRSLRLLDFDHMT